MAEYHPLLSSLSVKFDQYIEEMVPLVTLLLLDCQVIAGNMACLSQFINTGPGTGSAGPDDKITESVWASFLWIVQTPALNLMTLLI